MANPGYVSAIRHAPFTIHHSPFTFRLSIRGVAPDPQKAEIRRRVLAARDALDAPTRRALDARITPRLLALPRYRDARCVVAYVGFGTEFDTTAFIADVLARGKSLVLPRVERAARSLRLHAVRDLETELAAGVWGIREPRAERCAGGRRRRRSISSSCRAWRSPRAASGWATAAATTTA